MESLAWGKLQPRQIVDGGRALVPTIDAGLQKGAYFSCWQLEDQTLCSAFPVDPLLLASSGLDVASR